MSKIVTLSEEEVEILLSHHKQKLADLAKELEALTDKQRFSEARLHELTDHAGHDEAAHDEEHSDKAKEVHAEHGETSEEDLVFAPEAIHDEAGETSTEGGPEHQSESGEVHAEHGETAHEEETAHETEAVYTEHEEIAAEEEHTEDPAEVHAEYDEIAGEEEHAQEPAVEGYFEKAKTFLEEKLHTSDLLHPEHGETSHTEEPAY